MSVPSKALTKDVLVTCPTSAQPTAITARSAVLVTGNPLTSLWICPRCTDVHTTQTPAMIAILRVAGARGVDRDGLAPVLCEACLTWWLATPAERTIFLPLDGTETDTARSPMSRRTCPCCGEISLSPIALAAAVASLRLGADLVTDIADLVPDEADALATSSSDDLHAALRRALEAVEHPEQPGGAE